MSGGIDLYSTRELAFAPQFPALVAAIHPLSHSAVGGVSTNQAVGVRVVIPRSGTLVDFHMFVTNSSGNVDVGVYDTTATTRNLLWSTGSTACPTANQWTDMGDPNLTVYAGQQLDFALAADNNTAQFARTPSTGHAAVGGLPTGFVPAANGGAPKMAWYRNSTFVLPATIAESGMNANGYMPLLIARVA